MRQERKFSRCEIWDSLSGTAEALDLSGCDAMLLAEQFAEDSAIYTVFTFRVTQSKTNWIAGKAIWYVFVFVCFWHDSPPPSGPWPPHSRGFYITHNDTQQSVGLLWTGDQLVSQTSTWQHTTLTTDKHPCFRWDSNPQSLQASGRNLRLRSRGHWDRRVSVLVCFTSIDTALSYLHIQGVPGGRDKNSGECSLC